MKHQVNLQVTGHGGIPGQPFGENLLLPGVPQTRVRTHDAGGVCRGAGGEAAHGGEADVSQLRAQYRLRPADALQLATALLGGATLFVTNDRDLTRVTPILPVLVLEDLDTTSS